jgi:Skp family chaperone for outer membrane proteins
MNVHRTLAMAALAALLVWGTAASEEQAIKIGVVDLEQAISSTEEGKAAREEFQRKTREAQAKFQPMLDRYQALEEELKA